MGRSTVQRWCRLQGAPRSLRYGGVELRCPSDAELVPRTAGCCPCGIVARNGSPTQRSIGSYFHEQTLPISPEPWLHETSSDSMELRKLELQWTARQRHLSMKYSQPHGTSMRLHRLPRNQSHTGSSRRPEGSPSHDGVDGRFSLHQCPAVPLFMRYTTQIPPPILCPSRAFPEKITL